MKINFVEELRWRGMIHDIMPGAEEQLNKEKEQQELGVYKEVDLYKMHTYKDAIRRTGGAYILYPGDTNKQMKGFHEIIPDRIEAATYIVMAAAAAKEMTIEN